MTPALAVIAPPADPSAARFVLDDVDVAPALPPMLLGPELPRFASDEYHEIVIQRDSEARCAARALLDDGDVDAATWHAQRYEHHDRLERAMLRRWRREQAAAASPTEVRA